MTRAICGVLSLLMLFACASPRDVVIVDKGVSVLVHLDQPCPGDRLAWGCYEFNAKEIYLVDGSDKITLVHELEHRHGMLHGPWNANRCAVVLEGGNTQWKPGDVMCHTQYAFVQVGSSSLE